MPMDNNRKRMAMLVLSCDKYSDVWDAFGPIVLLIGTL